MAMNPAMLLRLKGEAKKFQQRHPKFVSFLDYAAGHKLLEGNVLELVLRSPDGQQVKTNLRLSAEDVALLTELQQALRGDR